MATSDPMAALPSRLGRSSIKGTRIAADPLNDGRTHETGPSRPVAFHTRPTARQGGQAWVYRATLPKTGKPARPKVSQVALRLQRVDQSTLGHRRLAAQLSELCQTDQAVAGGVVWVHEIFYVAETFRHEWVLDPDDHRRVSDPQGRIGMWAEVMDWHEHALHDILAATPRAPAWSIVESVRRVLPMLAALGACHDGHRIIHRDLDTRNVMVDEALDGRLRLTDWGSAVEARAPGHTVTATTQGKVGIQPPELRGRRSGKAQWYNDSWNLGFLLCQLFLGLEHHPRVVNDDETRLPDLSALPRPVREVVTGLLHDEGINRLRVSEAHARLEAWHAEQTRTLEARADRIAARAEARNWRQVRRRALGAAARTAAGTGIGSTWRGLRRTLLHRKFLQGLGALAVAFALVVGLVHMVRQPDEGKPDGLPFFEEDTSDLTGYPTDYEAVHFSEFDALSRRARRAADLGAAHTRDQDGTGIDSIRWDAPTGSWEVSLSFSFAVEDDWLTGLNRLAIEDPPCMADLQAIEGVFLAVEHVEGSSAAATKRGFDLVPATCTSDDPTGPLDGWRDFQDALYTAGPDGATAEPADARSLKATFSLPGSSDLRGRPYPAFIAGGLIATATTGDPAETATVWAGAPNQVPHSMADQVDPDAVTSIKPLAISPVTVPEEDITPFVNYITQAEARTDDARAEVLAVRAENARAVATVRLRSMSAQPSWPETRFELRFDDIPRINISRHSRTLRSPAQLVSTQAYLIVAVPTGDENELVAVPAELPTAFADGSDVLGTWDEDPTEEGGEWGDDGPVARFVLPDGAAAAEAGVWTGQIVGLLLNGRWAREGVGGRTSVVATVR